MSLRDYLLNRRDKYNDRYLLFKSAGVGPSFILDTITALNGYSLRKLKSTATKAIRVRRSSDNAEQDIGFIGEDLDETSLLSFVGANDGFVVTFYNQVNDGSSENLTRTTQSLQGKIVSSGVVLKKNGKASVDLFDGKSYPFSGTVSQPFTQSFVVDPVDVASLQRMHIGNTIFQIASNDALIASGSNISASNVYLSQLTIFDGEFNFPSGQIYVDGSMVQNGTFSENRALTNGTVMQLGKGYMSEYIVLPSVYNSLLNANQKEYYSIV